MNSVDRRWIRPTKVKSRASGCNPISCGMALFLMFACLVFTLIVSGNEELLVRLLAR